jgi:hypothetical protein
MKPYEAIKRDKTVHDHLFKVIRLNNPVAKVSSSQQGNKLMNALESASFDWYGSGY